MALVGTDVVAVARMERLLQDAAFLPRFFTREECAYVQGKKNKAETAAGLYAAKEAFAKAAGTGVRGFSLREVGVSHDTQGRPFYQLTGRAAALLKKWGVRQMALSISHDGGVAVATAALDIDRKRADFERAVQKTDGAPPEVLTLADARRWLPKRRRDTHKGNYGKVFLVAGSIGLTGAGIFASTAALKMGSGLITLGCPASLNPIFETCLHEVMTLPLPDAHGILTMNGVEAILQRCKASDALLFGCGLANADTIQQILANILPETGIPAVIDADGINALARNIDILSHRAGPVVLTPHWMEFSRLSGLPLDTVAADPAKCAADFARQHGVVLVLKSSETYVAAPDGRVRRNIMGNCGMATGGSGDVLSGVILSLLGQGLAPFEAASLGVYLHALSGDLAALDKGEYGMTPTDILENLPYAVKYVMQTDE